MAGLGPGYRRNVGRFFSVERLIADHPKQFEADLRRYCNGLDLRDLYRDGGGPSRLTYRLVNVLFEGLPGESLTKTAIRDALPDERLTELAQLPRSGHGPWSQLELLTAAQIDVLKTLLYVLVVSKGGKAQLPEPWPRPGVVAKRRKKIGAAQVAHLQRLRAEHEAAHGDTSGRDIVVPFTRARSTETG